VEQLESRLAPYAVSGNAWPNPQLVTLSFVPDGTIIGSNSSGYIYSNLQATFNAKFGSAATWQSQFLKGAQAWAQQTNLNFALVSDNGSPIGSGSSEQGDPNMGDIRIGGYSFGNSYLAAANLPPPVNNYSIAGDIEFNTAATWNINSAYDVMTVALHEIGHALGLRHTTVLSAAMFGSYTGIKQSLSSDDIAGIRAIYSNGNPRSPDVYDSGTGNNSFATATNITSSIDSTNQTALLTNLDITTTADVDFYTFTAPSGTNGTLTATVQSTGVSLLNPLVRVFDASQTQVASATGTGYVGNTLTVTAPVVAGQQYFVEVSGADSSAFGTGAYALTLNFGTGLSPTVPLPNTQTANGSPKNAGGGNPVIQSQEFMVNSFSNNQQQTFPQSPQAVAMDSSGNFVVTWSSYYQDGKSWGVYAQRYNAAGVPQGSEFRVNTTTADNQMYANVAMDSAGDFVITWSSHNQDGPGWGVYAQRYNAAGVAQGGEFRVNTTTADDQMYSSVAVDSAGDFVITWSSHNQDGSGWGVYAQRYNAAGVPQGGEFQVNTTTAGDQMYSTVAMDSLGNFVITWSSYNQDSSGWGVYAQRYNAAGVAQGGEFRVNTTTADDQMYSSVAMDSAGDFVITWSSHSQDGSGWGVYAQRYDAAGAPQGGEFQVNTTTADDQMYSTVAMNANGDFLITWSSHNQDGSGWGVDAQQFTSLGLPQGDEFQVNTTTAGDQHYSSVALDSVGDAVVVWSGNGATASGGVFAQRYSIVGSGLSAEEANDSFPDPANANDQTAPDQPEATSRSESSLPAVVEVNAVVAPTQSTKDQRVLVVLSTLQPVKQQLSLSTRLVGEPGTTIMGSSSASTGVVVPGGSLTALAARSAGVSVEAGYGTIDADFSTLMAPETPIEPGAVLTTPTVIEGPTSAAVPNAAWWPHLAEACFGERISTHATIESASPVRADETELSNSLIAETDQRSALDPLAVAVVFAVGLQAFPAAASRDDRQQHRACACDPHRSVSSR
jgi:hypothetical protein